MKSASPRSILIDRHLDPLHLCFFGVGGGEYYHRASRQNRPLQRLGRDLIPDQKGACRSCRA